MSDNLHALIVELAALGVCGISFFLAIAAILCSHTIEAQRQKEMESRHDKEKPDA